MKRAILGLSTGTFLAAFAWGQDLADPPSRVARVSFVEGSVSYRPAGVDEWAEATLNYPLTTGDRLWTAESSYAEVRIGATVIQLAPQASFTLSNLDDSLAQVSLSQGTIFVRTPTLQEGEAAELDTPNGALSLLQAGSYRVDVDVENGVTSVTVRSGEMDVMSGGRIFKVLPGRTLQLVADQEVADIRDAAEPDDWERACMARDQSAEQALEASESYVSPDLDGAEDLAQYGEWSVDDSYGAVWSPVSVATDWAPYRDGHWVFIRPWGWTWIDKAPWGFAPFHFGRWEFRDGRWVWIPGNRTVRPVYAPALVLFLDGTRIRATIPARVGPLVAWIPLGPGEVYRPPYRASDGYLRRINAPALRDTPNPSSISSTYQNRDRLVVVPREAFAGAQPVAPAVIPVPKGAGVSAQPVSIATVQPTRQSYLGSSANPRSNVATPPPAAVSRAVIVRHQISPAANPAVAAVPVVPTSSERPGESAPSPPVNVTAPAPNPVVQRRAEPAARFEQPAVDQRRAELQQPQQQDGEQQRVEKQRVQQQQAEQERAEQQRAEQQRAERQRAEQQRAEQQRAEQQRAEQQRAEQQRAEQQRAEQQRAEQQGAEQQRAEQQRAEQQRAEQQRAEQQRAEQQRAEQQRAEVQKRAEEAKKAEDAKKQ